MSPSTLPAPPLFSDRTPPCLILVLADPQSDDGLDARDIDALMNAAPHGPIEAFCAPGVDAIGDPRVRWHAATDDPGAAIARIDDSAPAGAWIGWIRSGTRAPSDWLARLRDSLVMQPLLATVSPLCPDIPAYAPCAPGALDDQALDDWLRTRSPEPGQIAAPLPVCGLMRARARAAIREAPGVDWTRALMRAGLAHGICTALAVHARARSQRGPAARATGSALFGLEGPAAHHPIDVCRRALTAAGSPPAGAGSPVTADASARPARLHIAHSWGGGLGAWVRDFCAADTDHRGLVLKSIGTYGAFGQRLALYDNDDSTTPLRLWELDLPIHACAPSHLQYRAVLDEIATQFDVDSIIVSSMIGHSLDALRTTLPTLLVAHDHLPFCVAIFAHFGGECRSCDQARLHACIADNPGHRFFRGVDADDWLALRDAFVATILRCRVPIVAPSQSTAARWRALMPALAAARIDVIPHGIDMPAPRAFEPPAHGRLRLLKVGRITEEKGLRMLEAALPEILRFADITLLGCGDEAMRLGRLNGVDAIPNFDRAALPDLIAQARPHLGLQLSIVPETFSYTLSELWQCGVPVLGCNTGSLADRIEPGVTGFLCAPDPTALLATLRAIDADRPILADIRARLLAMQARDCAAMVADYRKLFPPPPPRRRLAMPTAATPAPDPARGRLGLGPISIDPEARYVDAARAFLRYTLRKTASSPRLPVALRRLAQRLSGHRGPRI